LTLWRHVIDRADTRGSPRALASAVFGELAVGDGDRSHWTCI